MSSGLDLGLDTIERDARAGRVPRAHPASPTASPTRATPPRKGSSRRADARRARRVHADDRRRRRRLQRVPDDRARRRRHRQLLLPASAATISAASSRASSTRRGRRSPRALAVRDRARPTACASSTPPAIRSSATASAVVFRPGALFAGQERRIWVTLAVPQRRRRRASRSAASRSPTPTARERATLAFAEVPRVACVHGEDDFYAGVDVAGVDALGRRRRLQQDAGARLPAR